MEAQRSKRRGRPRRGLLDSVTDDIRERVVEQVRV